LKRVPNSRPHFSQATQISYIYKMYLKGIKACCAQAFATVLAIRSEISEEQRLKRISDLERFFSDLEVTNHAPRQDSNKKLNDVHVSKRSLRIYMYMKDVFIAEATIQKQHVNKGYLPGHYSHFR